MFKLIISMNKIDLRKIGLGLEFRIFGFIQL